MKKDLTNRNQKVQSNQFFWNLKRKFGLFARLRDTSPSFSVKKSSKTIVKRGCLSRSKRSLFAIHKNLFLKSTSQ